MDIPLLQLLWFNIAETTFFKKILTFSRTILMLPFKAALVGGFRSRKMENLIVRAITVFRVSVLRVVPQHFGHSHFPEQPLHP
jgi:hypothetical protein